MKLCNQVALVTGGAAGIGAAIVQKLAGEGALVFVNYRQNKAEADQVVAAVRQYGGVAVAMEGGVRDAEQVGKMIREILAQAQRLDILVNNAGVTHQALLFETDDSEWQRVVDTNLSGVFNCSKAVIKPMMLQGGGRIVNISSFLAERPWRGAAAYAASKGAVNSLTKAAAVELAPKNITVNAVAPGYIAAGMSQRIDQTLTCKIRELIPMRRLGAPEEVAALVAFLASPEAGYITGKIFGIDGGL